MCYSQMHTLKYTIKLIALHSFLRHTLTLLSLRRDFKARQYIKDLVARKPCLLGFVNNKGSDLPAHSRSLISAFVIRLLESIISRLLRPKFKLSS